MESLARAAAGVVLAVAASATALSGTFALRGGTQHTYARAVVSHRGGNDVTLDVTESTRQNGPPIRSYQLDMTKLMHMIAISDDFKQFMHVHPSFDRKSGTFRQTLTLDGAHSYNVYVDSQPKGAGQQVFRFTIPASVPHNPLTQPLIESSPSPTFGHAGPYTVTLPNTTLPAQSMQMLALDITKNGKPAADLKPYLGAAGHAVFINTSTLAYVHVHPMVKGARDGDMGSMSMSDDHGMGQAGPHLMLHVPALPAGSYKLWFQFQGGSTLYTVPFTLAVH